MVFPQPTCSDATPEYCHEPGENRTGAWGLGFRWAAVELLGVAACYPNPPCAPTSGPMHTEYFREGDPFTEGIRAHEHIQEVRERIAVELAADQMQGTVHLHYGDPAQFSPEDREEIFWANVDSVLTFGGAGMPIEQAFLGSYDLSWELIGKEAGNPVIEFNLTNASRGRSLPIPTSRRVMGTTRWPASGGRGSRSVGERHSLAECPPVLVRGLRGLVRILRSRPVYHPVLFSSLHGTT